MEESKDHKVIVHLQDVGTPQQKAIGELWDTFCWRINGGKEPAAASEGDTVGAEEAEGMALMFAQHLTDHYEEYLQLKNDPNLIMRRWAERNIPKPEL
jgi:hypothetical protein